MGTQKNRLDETVLLTTQDLCLNQWPRNYSHINAQKVCLTGPILVRRWGICHYSEYMGKNNIHTPSSTIIIPPTKSAGYNFCVFRVSILLSVHPELYLSTHWSDLMHSTLEWLVLWTLDILISFVKINSLHLSVWEGSGSVVSAWLETEGAWIRTSKRLGQDTFILA